MGDSMKIAVLLLAAMVLAGAQEVLTNDSIVKMVKSGLGEGVVVSMVQTQPGKYSLTADDLVKLKQAGVSDKVLAAMIAKGSSGAAPARSAASGPAPAAEPDIPRDLDVGVYYKKDSKWVPLLPEIVDWKTGGVLKHVGSIGIVKGDVNGHLQGTHSHNTAKTPVEVLIRAPEGVEYTEYQLIHLRENKGNREFRTVTGGVFHESSGAMRDVLSFDAKPVGKRLWKVVLPSLEAGEYGFLPPGAFGSANSASIGKMYTFTLLE